VKQITALEKRYIDACAEETLARNVSNKANAKLRAAVKKTNAMALAMADSATGRAVVIPKED